MTVTFKTLGCRLNQAEEVVFASQFLAAGWRLAGEGEAPDAIVLHSCAVTPATRRNSSATPAPTSSSPSATNTASRN